MSKEMQGTMMAVVWVSLLALCVYSGSSKAWDINQIGWTDEGARAQTQQVQQGLLNLRQWDLQQQLNMDNQQQQYMSDTRNELMLTVKPQVITNELDIKRLDHARKKTNRRVRKNQKGIRRNTTAIHRTTAIANAAHSTAISNGRRIDSLSGRVDVLNARVDTAYSGIATALAAANLPTVQGQGTAVGLAVGSFQGKTATVMGVSHRVDNHTFKATFNVSDTDNGFGVGWSYGF